VVMKDSFENLGRFDTPYVAFIAALEAMRPKLHRYCARMTGSVSDGEDVAQEAIFEAYRKLDQYDDRRPLAPWLLRIAHNRCIDFTRRRKTRTAAENAADIIDESHEPADPAGPWVGRALERLVTTLPPKERVCVLLKDVFDCSLEETAELVGSTVGGVMSALKRGRTKLASLPAAATQQRTAQPSEIHILYVERFNHWDWDAHLRISDIYSGKIQRQYFTTFERMPFPFRLTLGEVDGLPVLMLLGGLAEGDVVSAIIRLDVNSGKIARIRHYTRCPWLLQAADRIFVDGHHRTLNQQALDEGMLA
jgi:RNA polymerase sigma-70 factor, ECF subfamily